ncbi:hypothetical protein JCM11251_005864 [Rhodosporidiobolus azoricus]
MPLPPLLRSRSEEDRPLLLPTDSHRSTTPPYPPPPRAGDELEGLQPVRGEYERLVRGFYAYAVASEVYIIVSASLFLPILLLAYAQANGKVAPEHLVGCGLSSSDNGGEGREGGDGERCDVRLMGVWLDTASFSLFTYSASVLLQALTVISMGSLADSPHTRHRLLLTFAFLGSSLLLFFLILPETSIFWPLCTVLTIGANVCFGASIVCLNSYLPKIGRLAPSSLEALHPSLSLSPSASSAGPSSNATDTYRSALALSTSRISGRAIAAGYAAGIGVLVALLPVVKWLSSGGGGSKSWPLRVAIAISGGWWAIGTVPAAFWLRPCPVLTSKPSASTGRLNMKKESLPSASFVESVKEGWRGLFRQMGEWRLLPQTFVFLGAWFILSDAYATITSTAMLFAKTELHLPNTSLILIAILSPLTGIVGAVLFPLLQARGGFSLSSIRFSRTSESTSASTSPLSNKAMLLLLVLLTLLVPLWGLIHLDKAGEMYALACVFGALYGSFQGYARAVFSGVVPRAEAGRWFSLYSITDKSSSFLGPALVGIITNATGNIRSGFLIILTLFLLAIPILYVVDVDKGGEDAERYHRERIFSSAVVLYLRHSPSDPVQNLDNARCDFARAGTAVASGTREGVQVLKSQQGREVVKETVKDELERWGEQLEKEIQDDVEAVMEKWDEYKQEKAHGKQMPTRAGVSSHGLAPRSQPSFAAGSPSANVAGGQAKQGEGGLRQQAIYGNWA